MPLKLAKLVPASFPLLKHHTSDTDNLIHPPIFSTFQAPTSLLASARADFSSQQLEDLHSFDPTTHLLMVVDTDIPAPTISNEPKRPTNDTQSNEAATTSDIIAFARWHHYPHGYTMNRMDYCGNRDPEDPETWPEGMDVETYTMLCDAVFTTRREWMRKGEGRWSESSERFLAFCCGRWEWC